VKSKTRFLFDSMSTQARAVVWPHSLPKRETMRARRPPGTGLSASLTARQPTEVALTLGEHPR
jgi:hypothetical protein